MLFSATACKPFESASSDSLFAPFRPSISRFSDASSGVSASPHWAARAGWEKLLNTRGLMWKKLSDDERAAVDEQKAIKLMAQYPALIKRPVLDTGKKLLVGFSPETYAAELK